MAVHPSLVGGLWSAALDVLFPPTCAACGDYSRHQICPRCEEALRPLAGATCALCGKPTAHAVRTCRECRGRRMWFTKAVALWEYTGAAQTLIKSLKYGNRRHLAPEIAGRMRGPCAVLEPFDQVTWVPMTSLKRRKRGYNQSELIARSLAESLGVAAVPLLRRVKATRDQNQLDRSDRRSNNVGAFAARRACDISGKIVLLVDDVYTTGSTVADCSRALLAAGASEVKVVTAARTVIEA